MRDFHLPGRSPVYATGGMAATSMPAATLAAVDVLRAGGNAVDACVAAVALLGVIEPQSTGIGGDCFCLFAPASGGVVALNGSGRAPAALSLDAVCGAAGLVPGRVPGLVPGTAPGLAPTSAHAVTVPGAVAAWETLLAAHGTRGLDTLLAPAIAAAERGFVVAPRVAADWAEAAPKLRAAGCGTHLPPPAAGAVFRDPALAGTLRAIASGGARAFYDGPIAARTVATLRARGGTHTEADFADGRDAAAFVAPIHAPFAGMDIFECPPNGSGLMALMLLGILGGDGPLPGGPLDPLRLHRHVEAARLVYRDRDAFIADPARSDPAQSDPAQSDPARSDSAQSDFAQSDPAESGGVVERLLEPAYLRALRALIRDDRVLRDLPRAGEAVLPPHADTVYCCAVDRDGNACSLINSLYESFGTGIRTPDGIMLHNRGLGFSLTPGHPNAIGPSKRPMHTILPGMAMQGGRARMPFGVMGGHFQPMGQTLLLTNVFSYGLDVQEALDLPRVFPRGGRTQVERGMPRDVVAALAAMGHDIEMIDGPHGGGQAILIDPSGVLIGGSDPRKDGCALGYDR